MRKRTRKILLILSCLTLLLFCQYHADAQCVDEYGDPDVNCPIDGGLSLLVIAGVVYGVKKHYSGKKAKLRNTDSSF